MPKFPLKFIFGIKLKLTVSKFCLENVEDGVSVPTNCPSGFKSNNFP